MTQLLTPGETTYRQYGPLHVRIDRHHEGVTITTQVGTQRNPILSRTFTNAQLSEGRIFQAYLRDSAKQGLPVWQIEAGASAILAAAVVVDEAEQALIDGIRANLEATDTRLGVNRPAIPNQHDGWWAERRKYVVRPTATKVHTQQPTPAELDRMRHHDNGRVTCAAGQSWLLLRGIVDRGCADRARIEYRRGTRQIKAVHLNQRGWALLKQAEIPAA